VGASANVKTKQVLEQNFYRRVLMQLQQLLDLAKRSDTPENRKKFEWFCEQLLILGKNSNIAGWVELMKKSQLAISAQQNNYNNTAKLIIKEIKQAGELVVAGRDKEIQISPQLSAIVPKTPQKSQSAPQAVSQAPVNKPPASPPASQAPVNKPPASPPASQAPVNKPPASPPAPGKNPGTPKPGIKSTYPDPWQTGSAKISLSEGAIAEAKITFTGDLEQNVQQKPQAEPENYVDEFSDLFDSFDSLFEETENPAPPDPPKVKLEPKPEKQTLDFDKELSSWFDTQVPNLVEESFSYTEAEQANMLPQTIINNSFEQILNIDLDVQDIQILYYENLDELENLIESKQKLDIIQNKAVMIRELEQLIESPLALKSKTTISKSPTKLDYLSDKETEELLQKVNKTIERLPQTSVGEEISGNNYAGAAKGKVFEQTMRVPVKQLDNLSNLIGELVVKRNKLEEDQERLRQFLDNLLNRVQALSKISSKVQEAYDRSVQEENLQFLRHQGYVSYNSAPQPPVEPGGYQENYGLNRLELDRYNIFQQLAQEIIELIVRVRESASDIEFLVDETDQVGRNLRQVTTQLQEGLNKARMVTFAQVADRLPRAVREISLQLNKQAELQIEGREVLVDKMILENLYNPMTHLINNAITHGIESPEVRIRQGKTPVGKITVSSFLQGNQTLIVVSDDGAGIDREIVKTKAIQKGLITRSEAKIMSHQEIYDLLFHPGFSTKDKADDFAGRGVGLDVVRTSLIPIRGSVSIQSNLGEGTTFTIRLPLTLSICKAICCISNNAKIAFPIDGVEGSRDYSSREIEFDEQGRKCITWNGVSLPYQNLGNLLSYNRQLTRSSIYASQQEDDTICIVVLQGAGNLLAIEVDKLLPEQEIVINQIEGPVPKPAGIAGATVLGDGRVMPIADVLELIDIAEGRRSTDSSSNLWKKTTSSYLNLQTTSVKSDPMVLIVDDSITVRQMLSLSFAKSGYRVEEARDGQEAWEKLRGGLPCDIVFCDLEMPRMDGLTLLQNMHNDANLRTIPIALLTSRSTEKHKNIAAELGASGYFTKPYTEKDLLDAAERMIKGEVLIGNVSKNAQGSKNSQAQSGEPLVLIVDDSMIVREMLSITFKNAGYRVEQARDGQEALDKIRGGLYCTLVFCDIEMPRMDGITFLSRLQEEGDFSQIPVAMITSRGAEKHRRLAAERGAKAYFTKPYIDDELLKAAKKLMAGEVLIDESY